MHAHTYQLLYGGAELLTIQSPRPVRVEHLVPYHVAFYSIVFYVYYIYSLDRNYLDQTPKQKAGDE